MDGLKLNTYGIFYGEICDGETGESLYKAKTKNLACMADLRLYYEREYRTKDGDTAKGDFFHYDLKKGEQPDPDQDYFCEWVAFDESNAQLHFINYWTNRNGEQNSQHLFFKVERAIIKE